MRSIAIQNFSDVNKTTSHKAKAKDFQHSLIRSGQDQGQTRPRPGQGHSRHTATVLDQNKTRMWANAQRDGRPAEYRWRPLFNAAKFG